MRRRAKSASNWAKSECDVVYGRAHRFRVLEIALEDAEPWQLFAAGPELSRLEKSYGDLVFYLKV
jgi:hypothetical protein